MILGIDPGLTGAIALLDDDGDFARIWDMPVTEKRHGKGKEINAAILYDIFCEAEEETYNTMEAKLIAYIERVGPMPGQGVTSMFAFGRSVGVIEGVLAARGIPVHWVHPGKWKRLHGLTGRNKDAARGLAIEYYPEMSLELSRKKDVGRADALLIARYGMVE